MDKRKPDREPADKPLRRDEFDLFKLLKDLWQGRTVIIKTLVIVFAIAVFVAFFSKQKFTSHAKLLPEYTQQNSFMANGLLGQLGGLAGMQSFSTSAEVLRIELYIDIVRSRPFLLEILNDTVFVPEVNRTATLHEFIRDIDKPSVLDYVADYTVKLPFTILGVLRGENEQDSLIYPVRDSLPRITREEKQAMETISSAIAIELNPQSRILSVGVELSDPVVAAQVAKQVIDRLTEYASAYRTEKLGQNLEFIEERTREAEQRFREAQTALANFGSGNLNLSIPYASIKYERLQDDKNLAYNTYSNLVQQLEQSRIKLQEEQPVFTVLEPVAIPSERSSPRRLLILVASLFLGGILGATIVIVRQNVTNWKDTVDRFKQ